MRVSFVTQEIVTGLKRNLTMTIAVVITTAVSLALFGMAMLTGKQVDTMKDYWYDKVEISLFLCLPTDNTAASCKNGAVTEDQKAAIAADLNKLKPLVQDVFFETQAEAYQRFKERFKGDAIAENVAPDALPASYRVKLSDPTKYDIIYSAFNGRPGIYKVQDQRTVLEPFFRVLRAISVGSLLLAGIILAAA